MRIGSLRTLVFMFRNNSPSHTLSAYLSFYAIKIIISKYIILRDNYHA